MRRTPRTTRDKQRRGAVSVEFAFVMPVFIIILAGIVQASGLIETKNQMSMAAREGARVAAMNHQGIAGAGQTMNQKVEQDIRNYLKSAGLPYDEEDVDVIICDKDDPETPFDLSDPNNNYELFQIRIEIPYDEVGWAPPGYEDYNLAATVTFRNSRASLIQ